MADPNKPKPDAEAQAEAAAPAATASVRGGALATGSSGAHRKATVEPERQHRQRDRTPREPPGAARPSPRRPRADQRPGAGPQHCADRQGGRTRVPRCTSDLGSWSPVARRTRRAINTLEQVAEGLGWAVTVSRARTAAVRDKEGRVTQAQTVWEPVTRSDEGRYFEDDAATAGG